MRRVSATKLFLGWLAVGALGAPALWAQNGFSIADGNLIIGSTGNTIRVLADASEDVYAFSLHITFDSSKLSITNVAPGAAVTAAAPEYQEGRLEAGRIVRGVVFDTTDPLEKHMNMGQDLEVLVLTVSVLAGPEGSTSISFQNDTGPPWRRNVLTDADGVSLGGLVLDSSQLQLTTLAPKITTITPSAGEPGQVFTIIGLNFFDQPQLDVTVDGQEAVFTRVSDTELTVTAPVCATATAVDVQVCNAHGCGTRANGFTYTGFNCNDQMVPPIITSYLQNTGRGGLFFIVGENFQLPGLDVVFNGNSAIAFVLLGDGQTIQLSAPRCDGANPSGILNGPVEVRVCNNFGCDTDPAGYNYTMCTPVAPMPPVITSITPNMGPEETAIQILGDNFDEANLTVSVNGVPVTPTASAATTIDLVVPLCPEAGDGPVEVEVCTVAGCASEAAGYTYTDCGPEFPVFKRGDVDGSGDVPGSTTDIVRLANFLFLGGDPPPCKAAADINGDGGVPGSTTDIVYLANFLFLGGDPPPSPGPRDCGEGNEADLALGCLTHPCQDL
jgi:hypothetical protein